MNNPALVIIDMQEALVSGAYDEHAVVHRIEALADRVRSANLPVVFVQHNHSTYKPMMKGEPGWMIHRELNQQAGDTFVEKEASDAFYGTDLEATLRNLGVDALLIVGMQTEYCVDATCRSALSHGFNVVLISDCHTTGNSRLTARQVIDHHNAVLTNLVHPSKHIRVIQSSEVQVP